jgi:hypothetical protein
LVGTVEGTTVGEVGTIVGTLDGGKEGEIVGEVGLCVVGVMVGEHVIGKKLFTCNNNPV